METHCLAGEDFLFLVFMALGGLGLLEILCGDRFTYEVYLAGLPFDPAALGD